ncbi:MAG TPA: tail fiber protein [Bryobacteraceae bacterium]|jgi:microcystin-dependent protein|nr:tail fiber protein [Bryobacteraceae bacterium]
MAEPYLGEIRMFGFNFAPQGWAMCNGQLLPINQNTALFSLLGTSYGGNGSTTFALPDLRGRVAIQQGSGVGLTPYVIGEVGGSENVTLTAQQMPTHNHAVGCDGSNTGVGGSAFGVGTGGTPTNHIPGLATSPGDAAYSNNAPNATMNPAMIGTAGGNVPHPNVQPYLALTFCIALEGIFPSRN